MAIIVNATNYWREFVGHGLRSDEFHDHRLPRIAAVNGGIGDTETIAAVNGGIVDTETIAAVNGGIGGTETILLLILAND